MASACYGPYTGAFFLEELRQLGSVLGNMRDKIPNIIQDFQEFLNLLYGHIFIRKLWKFFSNM